MQPAEINTVILDLRDIASEEHAPRVLLALDALVPNQMLRLITSYDPASLCDQLSASGHGQISCVRGERGPQGWTAEVARSAPAGAELGQI